MKRILFTVCMLLGCVLFTMAQDKGYKIEGRLANTVNGKLLLVVKMDKGTIDISEADVTNGVFEFTGRMPEMTLVYLMPVKKNAVLASFHAGKCQLHDHDGRKRIDRGERWGGAESMEGIL